DAANQETGLVTKTSGGTVINRLTYSYDSTGNRTRVLESNGDRTTWTYDTTYQLKRERRSGAVTYDVTYAYDPAGNRAAQTDSGTRTTCVYDGANQLKTEQTGAARTTYLHDDCGNRTRKDALGGITIYDWDETNRMSRAIPPSNPVTLTYNAEGRRVKKVN